VVAPADPVVRPVLAGADRVESSLDRDRPPALREPHLQADGQANLRLRDRTVRAAVPSSRPSCFSDFSGTRDPRNPDLEPARTPEPRRALPRSSRASGGARVSVSTSVHEADEPYHPDQPRCRVVPEREGAVNTGVELEAANRSTLHSGAERIHRCSATGLRALTRRSRHHRADGSRPRAVAHSRRSRRSGGQMALDCSQRSETRDPRLSTTGSARASRMFGQRIPGHVRAAAHLVTSARLQGDRRAPRPPGHARYVYGTPRALHAGRGDLVPRESVPLGSDFCLGDVPRTDVTRSLRSCLASFRVPPGVHIDLR